MSTNRHKLKPSLVRKAEYYPISIAKLIISASRFQNELLVYKAALCFDLVKVRPKPNCCTIHELQVLKFFFQATMPWIFTRGNPQTQRKRMEAKTD